MAKFRVYRAGGEVEEIEAERITIIQEVDAFSGSPGSMVLPSIDMILKRVTSPSKGLLETAFSNQGILTTEQLLRTSATQLNKIRRLGWKSVDQLQEALAQFKLQLRRG